MRFYQLDIFSDECGDHGHKYFSNKADALKFKREWEAKSTEAVHWGNSDPDHPEAERVREVVRWYGKVPYALHHRHASALEWLKLKEEEL